MMWTLSERLCATSAARNRNLVIGEPDEVKRKTDVTSNVQNDLTQTLQEVVKIITPQGKAIGKLNSC